MATSKDLIKGWLQYAKQNNIKAGSSDGRPAEDSDLKSFLASADVDETVIDNIVSDLGLTEPEPEPEDRKLSDAEVGYLNKAKATIKTFNNRQKTQLYRELKSD